MRINNLSAEFNYTTSLAAGLILLFALRTRMPALTQQCMGSMGPESAVGLRATGNLKLYYC